jgi:hypothetical protein
MIRKRAIHKQKAEWQLAIIETLAALPPEQVSDEELETVFHAAAKPGNDEVQVRAAMFLSQLYPDVAPRDERFARRVHDILMRELREKRAAIVHPSCSWLVVTHLRDENLALIPWESAAEVASAAECFYGVTDGGMTADECHRRVRDLVKFAGQRFAQQGRWEEVYRLLSRVPLTAEMMDADLFRLRNTLFLYEQRRVGRIRTRMTLVIASVAAFVLFVSPVVFLNTENQYLADRNQPPHEWFDGLYWSVITFTTVGYGEIVPHTTAGRILAMVDSLFGVTVMGILAGTILSRVTPRPLP